MDNILKLLLGVLSVAGLIALALPETNPVAGNSVQANAEMNMSSSAETQQLPPPPKPAQLDSEPGSDIQIGAPSIDGNPMQPEFGLPIGTSPQMTSTKGDSGQSSQTGYTPPPYILPGSKPQVEGDANAPVVEAQGQ